MGPCMNRFLDVQIIHGWPFLLSVYRDGSLEDLIANPLTWSTQDCFASLIQIVRALRLVQGRAIATHQDLKRPSEHCAQASSEPVTCYGTTRLFDFLKQQCNGSPVDVAKFQPVQRPCLEAQGHLRIGALGS